MNPDHRIVLVGRSDESAERAMKEVLNSLPEGTRSHRGLIPIGCDHCSLADVRSFPTRLRRRLDETYDATKWATNGLDVVCLNAAVLAAQDSRPIYTKDGFEETFQTNYLAQFLLGNLLLDFLNPGGRFVFSTSGLFCQQSLRLDGALDPDTRLPRWQKGLAMIDGTDFDFKRSYAQSKLCLVAYMLRLNGMLKSRGAVANCFSPGLMPTTGLFRHQGDVSSSFSNKEARRYEKTAEWGAGALVFMCVSDEAGKEGGNYWRGLGSSSGYGQEFSGTSVSDGVLDGKIGDDLWQLSTSMTTEQGEEYRVLG